MSSTEEREPTPEELEIARRVRSGSREFYRRSRAGLKGAEYVPGTDSRGRPVQQAVYSERITTKKRTPRRRIEINLEVRW